MLTQDFATASSRRFLTGVSYADLDHDNFYSIGEGRNGMSVTAGGSTSTGVAGGYSLQVGTGVQNVTFSGGGLSAPISLAVTVLGEHQRQGRRRRSECRLHLGLAHRSRRRGDDHRAWHHRPFADRRRRQRHDLRHQGKRHAERRLGADTLNGGNGTDTPRSPGRARPTRSPRSPADSRSPDRMAPTSCSTSRARSSPIRRSRSADRPRRNRRVHTGWRAPISGRIRRISDLRHR